MVTYEFRCEPYHHEFEGVFGSHDEYQKQKESGLVECPVCGTKTLEKLLSTVNIGRSTKDKKGIRRIDIDEYKVVGNNFAEAARKMLRDEEYVQELINEGKKGIFGTATPKQVRELTEEGCHPIPVLPRHLDS